MAASKGPVPFFALVKSPLVARLKCGDKYKRTLQAVIEKKDFLGDGRRKPGDPEYYVKRRRKLVRPDRRRSSEKNDLF
jgi:hypothetical protein